MHEAVARMLARYQRRGLDDDLRALREIIQEVALLGLWRAKFFDRAAFYGGTALRILHGLDRFSEDLDFSLLAPDERFDLAGYAAALEGELRGFGFDVRAEKLDKAVTSAVQSAFLKTETKGGLLLIETAEEIAGAIPRGRLLKIRLEVDTDPPPGFTTETRYLLLPIPFAVRVYSPPDLFAGKMHAVLCRRWKTRVKGRDWYDLVWYAAHLPGLNLVHLEQRMRQTGDWKGRNPLSEASFRTMLDEAIARLDVAQARREVEPFVADARSLEVWSRDFFRDVAGRVRCDPRP
jgi:hypothetical protein